MNFAHELNAQRPRRPLTVHRSCHLCSSAVSPPAARHLTPASTRVTCLAAEPVKFAHKIIFSDAREAGDARDCWGDTSRTCFSAFLGVTKSSTRLRIVVPMPNEIPETFSPPEVRSGSKKAPYPGESTSHSRRQAMTTIRSDAAR